MTKIFLIIASMWATTYAGEHVSSITIREMPSMAACELVGKALVSMTTDGPRGPIPYRCVLVPPPAGPGAGP